MIEEPASPSNLIRAFYAARKVCKPEELRRWLAADVRWSEPVVENHMGFLQGADAVIDMLERASEITKGTFQLEVGQVMETGSYCSAIIHWEALKNGELVRGQELAVYSFAAGVIIEAYFFASNVSDDQAFWA